MDPPARHYIRIILRSDTTNDGMEYTHIYIYTHIQTYIMGVSHKILDGQWQ